jgi:hypothetical protein
VISTNSNRIKATTAVTEIIIAAATVIITAAVIIQVQAQIAPNLVTKVN